MRCRLEGSRSARTQRRTRAFGSPGCSWLPARAESPSATSARRRCSRPAVSTTCSSPTRCGQKARRRPAFARSTTPSHSGSWSASIRSPVPNGSPPPWRVPAESSRSCSSSTRAIDRTGTPVERAGEIAAAARGLGLEVVGVFTHGGHAYAPGAAESAGATRSRRLPRAPTRCARPASNRASSARVPPRPSSPPPSHP